MKIDDLEHVFWYSKDKPVQHVFFRGFSTNVFIIDQGDELWQIDAGTSPLNRVKRLLDMIKQDGLNPDLLSRIFLTHAHADHITGLKDLVDYAGCEVYIHENDEEMLENDLDFTVDAMFDRFKEYDFGLMSRLPFWLLKIGTLYSMGNLPELPPDHLLKDNDIIKGNRYSLELVHTPGHTPGHSCYYIPELKAMFIGDLIDPEFKNKIPINTPAADYDKFVDSVEKLLDYDVEHFLMGHAKHIYSGEETVRNIFLGALENLEKAREITIGILKANRNSGLKLKEFSGKYPKDIWPDRTDHLAIGYSVIKSMMKRNRIKIKNKRFFLID